MKEKLRFSTLLSLFLTFFKVGLLTFGGGYAMIPIMQRETSERKKWIEQNEILDIIAISESTPGPIAVNAATYIGYKVGKFWGSFFATLGLILPSFIIITLIAFFYKDFMKLEFINAIFKGLRVGVIILLFSAFLKLKKTLKLSKITTIIFAICLLINIVMAITNINFSYTSIIMIAIGLIFGIVMTKLNKKGDVE